MLLSTFSHKPYIEHMDNSAADAKAMWSTTYVSAYVQTAVNYSVPHLSAVPVVPDDYSVRLVQGIIGDHEGLVEVYLNGAWGTICDDRWGLADGNVVCHQIGFGDAVAVLDADYFGRGDLTSPIQLDEVACTGTEQNLGMCGSAMVHDCTHSEDAGVRCTSKFTSGQVRT